MENGQVDVLFYPVLKSSPLDRYDREQQKQLLAGKAILADTPTEDGRHTKAFVQIDPETKQVMSVPTPIIGRNLQVLAEEPAHGHGGDKRNAARRPADDDRGRRARHGGHRPARGHRHPLLRGRRAEMEGAEQARMGQVHLRGVRLLGNGRRGQPQLRVRRGVHRGACGTNRKRAPSATARRPCTNKGSKRQWHTANTTPKRYW